MVQPLQGNEVALGGVEIFFSGGERKGIFLRLPLLASNPHQLQLTSPSTQLHSFFQLKPNVSFWKEGSMFIRKITHTEGGDKHC